MARTAWHRGHCGSHLPTGSGSPCSRPPCPPERHGTARKERGLRGGEQAASRRRSNLEWCRVAALLAYRFRRRADAAFVGVRGGRSSPRQSRHAGCLVVRAVSVPEGGFGERCSMTRGEYRSGARLGAVRDQKLGGRSIGRAGARGPSRLVLVSRNRDHELSCELTLHCIPRALVARMPQGARGARSIARSICDAGKPTQAQRVLPR